MTKEERRAKKRVLRKYKGNNKWKLLSLRDYEWKRTRPKPKIREVVFL